MKYPLIILLTVTLVGCGHSSDQVGARTEEVYGARFKEGKGVELSETMRESIGLETVETIESSLANNVDLVTVVPSSSLLSTTTGTFVYVENGTHFLRTEVKLGHQDGEQAEVVDGLYAGDVVVKSAVRLLWYAELQSLRGGQACADGH